VTGANEESRLFERTEDGHTEAGFKGPESRSLCDCERQTGHFEKFRFDPLHGARERVYVLIV
jgi:hypothetical protein